MWQILYVANIWQILLQFYDFLPIVGLGIVTPVVAL